MRIISGYYKGRRIALPAHINIRPTTDFAKESLFNIINNRVDFEGLEVLDLFSGTGSISYEFVSRGAKEVVAVENNFKCTGFISHNMEILKTDAIRLIKMSVHEYLLKCTRRFDVIFADPPYDMPRLERFPDEVLSRNLLKPDGFFILEHGASNNFSEHPLFFEKRVYGSVNFSFFKGPDLHDHEQ